MLNVIASEMNKNGFQTQITSSGVIVSLKRPMSKMEVEIALEQSFEELPFSIDRVNKNSYLVK